jgi:glucose-6-phosphate 1-epimerase
MYLSPLHVQQPSNIPARGGMPVLFPQFANLGAGRKHGFARNVRWLVLNDQHYRLYVKQDEYDRWPHSAQLDLNWQVIDSYFVVSLTVENIGESVFEWTGGLHPYWSVPDLLQCRLNILNCDVQFTGQAYEQLFDSKTDLVLHCGVYSLEFQAIGFSDWMVWSPGREGAKELIDMPTGDWQRFLCIEPVCVANHVILQPNEKFMGTMKVRLVVA